jgi:O-6-methylguanine DNA methyltransferase
VLAERVGRGGAGRAAGGALARNPLPLIIPCHRVICANGKLGGFSGAGGVRVKRKMLDFERKMAMERPGRRG